MTTTIQLFLVFARAAARSCGRLAGRLALFGTGVIALPFLALCWAKYWHDDSRL